MNTCTQDSRAEEVYTRVKRVITTVLKIADAKISMESSYIEDFGANSLELLSLVVQLEFEFEKDIPEEDIFKITTVGSTVEYILKHLDG